MTHSEKALEVALTQLGVQEVPKGSNKGPQVDVYLKSVGINFPASWCMAFVYWSFNEAAISMSIPNMLAKTGGVLDQWNKRKAKYSVSNPKPGDIFIMDFGGGKGHTGIVKRVDKKNIYTVEGNSNDEGSREGHEVCERLRSLTSIKGYLRFQ